MRKQLRTTQSAQSGTQSSTKGKVLIDYEDGGERAGQTSGPSYDEQYRQSQQVDQSYRQSQDRQSQAGKQRYAEQQAKRYGDVDQLGKQPTGEYPPSSSKDQRQNNHQNLQNHQTHQIKQFEKNKSHLMNHGTTAANERPVNEGEPNGGPTYGTKFESERAKCPSDNKQQIEFNSRLKSAPKFDGHFCQKICGDNAANERRLKENYEQLADDGRQKVLGRQRTTADDFERIRQRTTTAQRSGVKQTNQLDAWPYTGQSNDQSNQQTRALRNEAFDRADCGCCCCPSFCLARSLKLRRELSKRQLESEFCNCEFCENTEFGENRESQRNQNGRDEDECGSTSSFGSCEPEHRCKKKCRILKLIRENVSSRSNSLGSLDSANEHQNRRLFDHEYRRLVRKNRQRRTRRPSGDRADQCGANEDAIQRRYDSWSSHLHISSPCR